MIHKPIELLSHGIEFKKTPDSATRTFVGMANSGMPMSVWGEQVVVDLESIRFAEKIPVLLQHNADKRAGFGAFHVRDSELWADGDLLESEHGKSISDDADAGFPWQMSVRIHPDSYEELSKGKSAIVNSRNMTGPMTILRDSQVSEVSFVALGADQNTHAKVFDMPNNEGKLQEDHAAALEAVKIANAADLETAKTSAFEEGKEAGIALERQRVSDLMSIPLARVYSDEIRLAIKNGDTKEAAALAILQRESDARENAQTQLSSTVPPVPNVEPPPPVPEKKPETFESKVSAFEADGKTKGESIRLAARQHPNLHQDWLARRNGEKS